MKIMYCYLLIKIIMNIWLHPPVCACGDQANAKLCAAMMLQSVLYSYRLCGPGSTNISTGWWDTVLIEEQAKCW